MRLRAPNEIGPRRQVVVEIRQPVPAGLVVEVVDDDRRLAGEHPAERPAALEVTEEQARA